MYIVNQVRGDEGLGWSVWLASSTKQPVGRKNIGDFLKRCGKVSKQAYRILGDLYMATRWLYKFVLVGVDQAKRIEAYIVQE